MLKKLISLFFITTAYAFIVGHSIIPHHHHDTEKELTEHHQTHHHGNEDSNDLSHILSHFIHSADGFTTLNNHNISNTFFRQPLLIAAVMSENLSLYDDVLVLPLLNRPPAEQFIYIPPHSLSSGLRAPPIVLA